MDTQDQEQVNEKQNEVVETTKAPQEESSTQEEIHIPDNWETDVKDFINGIQDQAGKKAIFDKLLNFDNGYQKKFRELAEQRKAFDEDRAFLDNYRNFEKGLDPNLKAEILARYSNIPNYMNSLHQMDIVASRDPVQFIRNFCANNGINAEQITGTLSDKTYQNMQQARSNDALRAEILNEVKQEQARQQAQDEINRFVAETNPDGSSKHPLLQDKQFVADMDALKGAFPNKTWEEIYQIALSARPDLREQAVKAEAEKIALANKQADDVVKAKSVLGVKANTPMVNAQEHRDWRSSLNDAFNDD